MSLALYRLYRPSRLSEVIGQEHVTQPLARALSAGRVHHAFLFSGPRGCGKTSTARILARSLLCEQGPTPDPCGECQFCTALAPNGPGLVDVIELDAASHGGVDDTRELRERAAFMPAQARYKVYIIDEAHMVTKDGFNALLKLIEEPPDHLKFIFATTEVEKVIPTIRSRTFNYAFRLVPARLLQQNLAMICESEGVPFDPVALALIARASGGSVRDAQSIMGQLIAGSGPEGLRQADVAEQLGVTDEAMLDAVVTALVAHDGAELFTAVRNVVEAGHDVRRFVTDLLHHFRDLLLLTHVGGSATADVLDVSEDRREVLVAQAEQFGPAELTRLAGVVNDGLSHVKGSTSPRLQLEILMGRLLIPAAASDPEALLARIDVLERRVSAIGAAAVPQPGAPGPSALAAESVQPASEPRGPVEAEDRAPSGPPPSPIPETPAPAPPGRGRGAPGGDSRSAPPPPPRPPLHSLTGLEKPGTGRRAAPTTPPVSSGAGSVAEPGPAAPVPAAPVPAAPGPAARPTAGTPGKPEPATPDRGGTPGRRGGGLGSGPGLEEIRAIWPELMSKVRNRSRVAAAAWDGAEPVDVAAGVLQIHVPTPGQEASIRGSRRDLALHTLLIEEFRIDVKVEPTSGDRGRAAAGGPGEPVGTGSAGAGGGAAGPGRGSTTDRPPRGGNDVEPPDEPADEVPDEETREDPGDDGLNQLSGIDLAKQALGATQIDEIENT